MKRLHWKTALLALAFAALFAALFPALSLAQSELTVLGFEGQPIRIVQATYGDLFPIGTDTDPRHPVLALELTRNERPGGASVGPSVEYLLVPGTEGPDQESATSLLFDKASDALYIFWESHQLHAGERAAELRLVRLGAEADWSEVLEISGNPLSPGSHPQLSVTQDTARFESPEGETVTQHRTLLHLVWTETGPAGERAMYTPIVLQDGTFQGSAGSTFAASSSFDLSSLATELPTASPAPAPALVAAPAVSRGRNERSVVLAFADSTSGALLTAEILALPQELQRLAGGARPHITIVGHRMPRPRLADEMQDYVLGSQVSQSFHPTVVDYIAERVRETVLSFGETDLEPDLEALGEQVWEEILRSGASFGTQGLAGTAPDESTLLAMESGSLNAERGSDINVLELRPLAVFPAPQTGDSPTRIFVSPSGHNVVVTWLGQQQLLFREWENDGWTDVQTLQLGQGMTLPQAYELVENRVR